MFENQPINKERKTALLVYFFGWFTSTR